LTALSEDSMNKMKSLAADEIVTERKLGRRSMALMGGAAAGTVAALGVLSTTGCCLSGAGNAGGATTGCSDSDPSDGAGRGTHCGAAAPGGTPGMASGCSDSDPTDGAGAGTHC
jgi:hypothetical protein